MKTWFIDRVLPALLIALLLFSVPALLGVFREGFFVRIIGGIPRSAIECGERSITSTQGERIEFTNKYKLPPAVTLGTAIKEGGEPLAVIIAGPDPTGFTVRLVSSGAGGKPAGTPVTGIVYWTALSRD
jgi:hypothetical protein